MKQHYLAPECEVIKMEATGPFCQSNKTSSTEKVSVSSTSYGDSDFD